MRNLTVVLENRPGALATACEALGQAGINVEGMFCFASQGIAMMYVAVQDGAGARRALERAGLKVSDEREVVAAPVEERLGAAGEVLRRIADAGVNVELAYIATGSRVVIAAQEVERARTALGQMRAPAAV